MNILLVDDDQDIADYLTMSLKTFGFHIHHLSSGIEALLYLEGHKVDLMLLDWNMPEMTGLEVLKKIRLNFSPSELPIIMVTSISETENIVHALGKGCNDYITKPVNLETIAARIKTQLTIKKIHDENIAKNKLEALNEVITTLNHEINNPLFIALNHVRKACRREDYTQLEKVDHALVRITNIVKQISDLNSQSKEILKREHVEEAV